VPPSPPPAGRAGRPRTAEGVLMASATTPQFEFVLSLPHDARFAAAIRDLAAHAAIHYGCATPRAQAFGEEAERLFRSRLEENLTRREVPVVVRSTTGRLELLIDERTISLDL